MLASQKPCNSTEALGWSTNRGNFNFCTTDNYEVNSPMTKEWALAVRHPNPRSHSSTKSRIQGPFRLVCSILSLRYSSDLAVSVTYRTTQGIGFLFTRTFSSSSKFSTLSISAYSIFSLFVLFLNN